jgi:hypothetical protein
LPRRTHELAPGPARTCLELEEPRDVVEGREEEDGNDEGPRLDDLLLTEEGATHRDVPGVVNVVITISGNFYELSATFFENFWCQKIGVFLENQWCDH